MALSPRLSRPCFLASSTQSHKSPKRLRLRVTERFTRRDFGHMDIQITIDDPEMYTRPWMVTIEKRLIADDELIEFMCENEKDLPHMVGK